MLVHTVWTLRTYVISYVRTLLWTNLVQTQTITLSFSKSSQYVSIEWRLFSQKHFKAKLSVNCTTLTFGNLAPKFKISCLEKGKWARMDVLHSQWCHRLFRIPCCDDRGSTTSIVMTFCEWDLSKFVVFDIVLAISWYMFWECLWCWYSHNMGRGVWYLTQEVRRQGAGPS